MLRAVLDAVVACGWFLLPLLAVASFILVAALERWRTLAREPAEALPVVQQLHRAHAEGGVPAVLAEAEAVSPSVATIVRGLADAPQPSTRALDEALTTVDDRVEGPLLWLRIVSDLTPLVACAFSLVSLVQVNRLLGSTSRAELQALYNQALTLTVIGLVLALFGRLAVLFLERRRAGVMATLRRIGDETAELFTAGQSVS